MADRERNSTTPVEEPQEAPRDDTEDRGKGDPAPASAPPGADAASGPGPEELRRLLEQREAELAETKNRYLYLAAELENYKRRAERRLRESLDFASEPLLKDLLPVLDNLERAVAHAREAGPEAHDALVEGLDHVIQQFHDVLARHGVEPVPGEGERFDPNVHEAVTQVLGERDGRVHEVYEKGYRLKGRLLRPAKVAVTKVAPTSSDG